MKTMRISFVISLFLLASGTSKGQTIFVDANATGANNGSSWTNAYIYLQDALTAATSGDQIWVAEGAYKPDQGIGKTPGDRMATFELKAGVSIYGGFPSGGGTWDDRDPNLYETILSGDLNGDDEPNFVNNGENSYHVTHIGWSNGTTTLDGFTVSGGNANGSYPHYAGGGLAGIDSGKPVLRNCVFKENFALIGAGIVLGISGDGNITNFEMKNCTFQHNKVAGGGYGCAIYLQGYSPLIIDCLFIQNSADGWNGIYGGGAIYCHNFGGSPEKRIYSNPTIINCKFIANHVTEGYGGAIYIRGQGSPKLISCIFAGNSAVRGGAIYEDPVFVRTNAMYRNCAFVGNSASDRGGGMCYLKYDYTPLSSFKNCILWGNRDSSGINEWSQIRAQYGQAAEVSVTNSCIQDTDANDANIPFGGVANHNIDDNPRFMREPNDGGDGWSVGDNDDFGNLRLSPGSPCIDDANNAAVPPDSNDIDNDGNTTEPIPWDIDGRPRFADGDCNSTDIVDMGAYEFTYAYFGDFDEQCDVDFVDFAIFASQWLEHPDSPSADIAPEDLDGIVDELDLAVLASHWLEDNNP